MPTIDVSEKTKKLLRKVKKREQFKSFDGAVRYLLMKEKGKERNIVIQDDSDRIKVPLSLIARSLPQELGVADLKKIFGKVEDLTIEKEGKGES